MRKLKKGMHRFTSIYATDEPGSGGANHEYYISKEDMKVDEPIGEFGFIKFQKGPTGEVELNGCFIEDLINICVDRLECFQSGEFSCRENALALTKLEEALHWLNYRTKDRQDRGVEGIYQQ